MKDRLASSLTVPKHVPLPQMEGRCRTRYYYACHPDSPIFWAHVDDNFYNILVDFGVAVERFASVEPCGSWVRG